MQLRLPFPCSLLVEIIFVVLLKLELVLIVVELLNLLVLELVAVHLK